MSLLYLFSVWNTDTCYSNRSSLWKEINVPNNVAGLRTDDVDSSQWFFFCDVFILW